MTAHNVHCLLHPPAFGDHVFDHKNLFAGRNLEAAPQHQFALLLFDKDEAQAELPRHFLADHQPTHRGSYHRGRAKAPDFVRQRRAQPLHRGHPLESERALEELPAVQSATKHEVPFEQRARVAEQLQDFVVCHGMKSWVSVLKYQANCFLLASGPVIFNPPPVPKWFKFIIALLLLPACAGAVMALAKVVLKSGSADLTWVPFVAGVACWAVIYLLLPKPMWIYVFGHELTHALWAWLFGGDVKKFKATSQGGHVVVTKTNFLIALAPYFFPLYAVIVIVLFALGNLLWGWRHYLAWFHLSVGAAYAFHVTLTAQILQTRQTDITSQGWLFSAVVIFLGNVFVLLVGIPLLAAKVDLTTALGWWLECTELVVHRLGRLL